MHEEPGAEGPEKHISITLQISFSRDGSPFTEDLSPALTSLSSTHFHVRFKHTWRTPWTAEHNLLPSGAWPPSIQPMQGPFHRSCWLSRQLFCPRLNFTKPQFRVLHREGLYHFHPSLLCPSCHSYPGAIQTHSDVGLRGQPREKAL